MVAGEFRVKLLSAKSHFPPSDRKTGGKSQAPRNGINSSFELNRAKHGHFAFVNDSIQFWLL
jgi:hypothetical protein